jgi:D-alanine-D-alanine ligase
MNDTTLHWRQQLKSKVAVLYGGTSSERDVSLMSGQAVFDALQALQVPAELVDTQDAGWTQRFPTEFAHAFIALHGPGGEDGTVQGLLETLGVSYTGSGVLASALAMDKWRTKQLWAGIGLPTPEFELLTPSSDFYGLISRWGGAVVKPACEGSSIGMAIVSSAAELKAAYQNAAAYDPVVLVERRIRGPEYTVAVLGRSALPSIRLETDNVFYDYEAKYVSNETRYFCPSGLSAARETELAQLALDAFSSLGCRDWGRADVMEDEQGKFYLLEVNTSPGMTSHSLVPMAARAVGLDFNLLVAAILGFSIERGVAP